jgi:hypothetical protein
MAWCVALAVGLLGSARLHAQSSEPSDQATGQQVQTGPRILPVVTLQDASDESESYWWRTPQEPAWTPFDVALRRQLAQSGVRTIDFSEPPRISRIYQRPNLSLQNAAALCSLLDVTRLLHGRVSVQRHVPGPSHGMTLAQATAELRLVDTGARAPTVLQEVTIERVATAPTIDTAVKRVQQQVAKAASSVVARISSRSGGRMAIDRTEPLIGVWGARRAMSLQTLKSLMLEADGVNTVELRWAAEGVVGFEINPKSKDSTNTISYVARYILKQKIDALSVRRREQEVSGLVSLEVTDERGANGSKSR